MNVPVIIIGAGISGLSTAWYLDKKNIPFKIIERGSPGGVIQSESALNSVFDLGPNTIRDKNGKVRELADGLGLTNQLVEISSAFKTRYIARNGRLHELKPSLASILGTSLISHSGKLRTLKEPFIKKNDYNTDESIGSFFSRRIGKEVTDYLVDPVFSGIYAGDIYQMSMKQVLPELWKSEKEYGSLIKGVLKERKANKENRSTSEPAVLSFKKGLQQLTNALSRHFESHIIQDTIIDVKQNKNSFNLSGTTEPYACEHLISTVPAFEASLFLKNLDEGFHLLHQIEYAPIITTHVLFNKAEMDFDPDGFGFLIPSKENSRLLGAIWKSAIFPELTGDRYHQFTLMAGGMHNKDIVTEDITEIESELLREFQSYMKLPGHLAPQLIQSKIWKKGIPHFHVGYRKIMNQIQRLEKDFGKLHICGNFRWGVAIPDCISGAEKLVKELYVDK